MTVNLNHHENSHYIPANVVSSKAVKIEEPIELNKSNILLVGPTGTGKTLISKTIAEILDVPYSINDATPFTQAGYVGEDAETCITRLLQNSDYDVARAQKGIIFIDEIDKIAKKTDASNPGQRDVSGEGVQQGLLRLLEGTTVNITVKNNHNKRGLMSVPQQEEYQVNTSNILFICSGAFVGLDKIILERLSKKKSIGFEGNGNEDDELNKDILKNPLNYVEPEDLIKFGLIPEFVGRMPVLANTNQLSVVDLMNILIKPKNSIIKQYEEVFKRNGIQLFFQKSTLKSVAELAIQKNTGARGLRRILETILNDIMYNYFGTDYRYIIISNNNVKESGKNSRSSSSHRLLDSAHNSMSNISSAYSLSNISANIINSTKSTVFKYGEEEKLIACLKDNEIEFNDSIIMTKNTIKNNPRVNVIRAEEKMPTQAENVELNV